MRGVGADRECLALSASRRTIDSCISQLRSRAPNLLKIVTREPKNNNKKKVFRESSLSYVNFGEVFWHPSGYVKCLILGFYSGDLQIWRIGVATELFNRLSSFKTSNTVDFAALIDDIPGKDVQNHTSSPVAPDAQTGRVAIACGCSPALVGIFGSGGKCWHVLHQPWPVLSLKSSICRSKEKWTGTLMILTTLQIRVYDTADFELRFSISQFQIVKLPTIWQWLVPDTEKIGPAVALSGRWLVYQENSQICSKPKNENCFSSWVSCKLSSCFPESHSFSHLVSSTTSRIFSNTTGDMFMDSNTTLPLGGPIVVVDVTTSLQVGKFNLINSTDPTPIMNHLFKTTLDSSAVEVQDGAWWLSHVERSDIQSSLPNDVKVYAPSPLLSKIEFDHSGTLLLCADWAGREVYVTKLHVELTSSYTVYAYTTALLCRGRTAGSIIHIACSRNLVGSVSVVVLTDRGSCHVFPLPSSFHLTQPISNSNAFAYPVSCRPSCPFSKEKKIIFEKTINHGTDYTATKLEVPMSHKWGSNNLVYVYPAFKASLSSKGFGTETCLPRAIFISPTLNRDINPRKTRDSLNIIYLSMSFLTATADGILELWKIFYTTEISSKSTKQTENKSASYNISNKASIPQISSLKRCLVISTKDLRSSSVLLNKTKNNNTNKNCNVSWSQFCELVTTPLNIQQAAIQKSLPPNIENRMIRSGKAIQTEDVKDDLVESIEAAIKESINKSAIILLPEYNLSETVAVANWTVEEDYVRYTC